MGKDLKYYSDSTRHLVCEPFSIENLHKMAEELHIKKCWFHNPRGKNKPHYDIPKTRIKEVRDQTEKVSQR